MFIFFSWFFISVGVLFFYFGLFLMDNSSMVVDFLVPLYFFVDMPISFVFDFVSLMFFSCVSFISGVVFYYSGFYMGIVYKENSDQLRFVSLLFLFVFSMFFLVFSFSWPLVMLGWDGLGIVSFLLVIYFNDSKSLDSGMVTVLTNRLGDCFFLLSFSFMFYLGEFSFSYLSVEEIWFFVFLVIVGCMTKSAQFPFSSWLPAAMAAPTPVSSLVHSSTLVTAGVYLLIRFNFLLASGYFWLLVFSMVTMTFAGLFACVEVDFKKIVAMSTLSQLGFMIFSVSCGFWVLGFLHMMFHAFFKSSLFMSTGSLMHFVMGNQDSRYFGGFYNSFFSKLFFVSSCLSLMGFPFCLGFYSKDSILSGDLYFLGGLMNILFCFFCCFTVAYSLRLLMLGFLGEVSFDSGVVFVEEKKFFFPVFFLFLFSFLIGNFFMFNMIPFLVVSFFELFMGVVVLFGGFLFFFLFSCSYLNYCFYSSMGFLPNLISLLSVKTTGNLSFKMDSSWGEVFGGKGIEGLYSFYVLGSFYFYRIKFLYFVVLLFLVVMYYVF